jgi:hypothetical protein
LLSTPPRLLPLYAGPLVTVRIGGGSGGEYKLSKNLICNQSRYFAKMFEEGKFKEGEDQSCTLEPIDDGDEVVTNQSFEILVQWLYLGKAVFPLKPEDEITLTLNVIRLADMVEVTGMKTDISEYIKTVILKNPAPSDQEWSGWRHTDSNMVCILSQHLRSAWKIPDGHPVRKLFAAAAVEGYLRCEKPKFH